MKAKRQFTLRLDEALLNKLGYIAEYEGRTKNKEIQHLIQQHIVHFEQEHGAIDLREIQRNPCHDATGLRGTANLSSFDSNGLDNETAFRTVRDSAGRTGISDETGNC